MQFSALDELGKDENLAEREEISHARQRESIKLAYSFPASAVIMKQLSGDDGVKWDGMGRPRGVIVQAVEMNVLHEFEFGSLVAFASGFSHVPSFFYPLTTNLILPNRGPLYARSASIGSSISTSRASEESAARHGDITGRRSTMHDSDSERGQWL